METARTPKRRKIETSTMILQMNSKRIGKSDHYSLVHFDKTTERLTVVALNDNPEKVSAAFDRQLQLDKAA